MVLTKQILGGEKWGVNEYYLFNTSGTDLMAWNPFFYIIKVFQP